MITRRMKRLCNQPVVYWAPKREGRSGQSAFADPVQLYCRWEDVNEQFLDKNNNVQMTRSKVYTFYDPNAETNNVVVVELGVVWRGLLEDAVKDRVTGLPTKTPFDNKDAYEVRRVDTDPDKRGTDALYTLYL